MTFTLFVREDLVGKPYSLSKHWVHKFDEDHFLITAEHGAWIVLSREEFDLLKLNKLNEDPNLFKTLEEKGIVITQNNIEVVTQMYRERFHYLFNGINLHIIVPTLRCNHNCVYCAQSSKPIKAKGFDMDRKTAKAIVDFIFQSPSQFLNIEFQGGEPLANFPILEYIVEYCKKKNSSNSYDGWGWWKGKKNIEFKMVSNLSLMDDDILSFLMKNNVKINTSLDGPKHVHDKNRPLHGYSSYEKTVYWINRIKNEKNYRFFGALPTITRYSLRYPEEIVDEYIKHGFTNAKMRPLNIAGVAIDAWKKIGYTSEEFFNFWERYVECVLSLNKRGTVFWDDDSFFMLRRILTLKPPFNACLGAPCGACLIQTAYNQWGDVYTCDEARSNEIFKLGNVKKKNYKEIFTSDAALSFIGLTSGVCSLCNECVWHPFCSPCLVSSFGAQKNIISKLPVDFVCKIRKSQTEYIFKKLVFSKEDRKILLKWVQDRRI